MTNVTNPSTTALGPSPLAPRDTAMKVAPHASASDAITTHASIAPSSTATARPASGRPYTSADALIATAATSKGTSIDATTSRPRVLPRMNERFEQAVDTASRTRPCNRSGTSRSSGGAERCRSGRCLSGARSIFPPTGCMQRGTELLACAMRTLLDDVRVRTEQHRRFLRAEILFLEQHIGGAILLRHLAELDRDDVEHVRGGDLILGRGPIGASVRLVLADIFPVAELLGTASPISQSRQVHRASDRERPMQRARAAGVGSSRPVQLQERLLKAVFGLGGSHREAQAEAIQPRCHQLVQLIEHAVVAIGIALHEMAEAHHVGLRRVRVHGAQ